MRLITKKLPEKKLPESPSVVDVFLQPSCKGRAGLALWSETCRGPRSIRVWKASSRCLYAFLNDLRVIQANLCKSGTPPPTHTHIPPSSWLTSCPLIVFRLFFSSAAFLNSHWCICGFVSQFLRSSTRSSSACGDDSELGRESNDLF